ncbi:MAG: M28 family peptidase [Promethearchaeota archaeon]
MSVKISNNDSKYMYDFIAKIIDEVGPRMPCSKQEAEAAEIIKREMEGTCDEVTVEPFTCHPRAFLGWIKLDIILLLTSILLFILSPALSQDKIFLILTSLTSFILVILAFVITFKEFFNYEEFIDPLFKKQESQNVIGTFKSKVETRKILMFSGHVDSAWQYNLLRYLKGAGYAVMIVWGFSILFSWMVGALFAFVAFLIGFDIPWIYNFSCWLLFLSMPPLIALSMFISPGDRANKVPGAVDNLSAIGVVLGIGRWLAKNREIIPDDLEIRLIAFGCEEAGLRGAYRYAEKHGKELKSKNAELINMDGVQSSKNITLIAYEPTTRTQHDKEVTERIKKACDDQDIKVFVFGDSKKEKLGGFFTGGTDAAAFSKANLKAGSFGSLNLKEYMNSYHTCYDTIDKIEKGALELALKVCIKYILNEIS